MAKYSAWIIEKKYFKVEVEADSPEQAEDLLWQCDLDNVFDTQWDMYDIEEIK